ncbi:MAG: DNA translocase FtsK [Patescibacteria group bacterium]|nr:DNA translocase FtsK [Patescibacteria group bacterium]
MGRNNLLNNRKEKFGKRKKNYFSDEKIKSEKLHPDIKKSVLVVISLGLGVLLVLAGINQAGPWGAEFYNLFFKLFGWGYYLLPVLSFLLSFSFLQLERKRLWGVTLVSSLIFIAAGLGFIDIIALSSGGLIGNFVGSLKKPFGNIATLVITFTALVASFLIIANRPIKIPFKRKEKDESGIKEDLKINLPLEAPGTEIKKEIKEIRSGSRRITEAEIENETLKITSPKPIKNYTPPPLSLLSSSLEKPTIGDLQANANIIKRTLESFGINVEMGEINVGPTVTRYSLKPAEGMKLSRITALSQDLALALAAHPIRIEAPIPGKSLVGIEVPNKAAALVRVGNLFLYPEFSKSDPITFALGRNVSGEPIFPSIDKMPHLLVAGATGSGKSIAIHCLIISLLYKNSPEMLRLLLIDPKRVELSVYDGLPHLIAPVVTDNKKAMSAFRWVINEMERRYEMLLNAGARDIKSYNHKNSNEPLPYIVLIVDELADLMATYGREVEGSIIRLAQMARATGIHLVVSTQRPSVEVITGLIKANITSRIALQVASQVDSRTILDTAGAEKLLGRGDLLYVSAEKSKPQRIQSAYITEDEIKKVVNFIRKNNEPTEETISIEAAANGTNGGGIPIFDDYAAQGDSDEELFEKAIEIVRAAKKASASLLQRRLKIGYARAARLLDMMEEKDIVGPGDGAKPREIKI